MPRNVAQLTGMTVTAIIVFGTDMDVVWAVPFGIMAGALATYFVAFADWMDRTPAPISLRAGSR
jgi:hypothetical protein